MKDKREVFEEVISPILMELKKACYMNSIPMFVSCAVCDNNENKTTEYKNDMVSPAELDVTLNDNKICEMVKILNGFVAVPPEEPMELEFD